MQSVVLSVQSVMQRKIKSADISLFTQQLKSLIKSKVKLLPALNILYEQTNKGAMKEVIHKLYDAVAKGKMFSQSLGEYPHLFPPLYVSIIKTGESVGRLEEALIQISAFMSSQEELKRKIQAALAYPIFMFLMGVVTILVLFTFVIPRLGVIFTDFGENLPLPTKILLQGGKIFSNVWFWVILAVIGLLGFFSFSRRENPQSSATIKQLKMNLPFLGKIMKNEALARFARSLVLLLNGGVSVFEALKVAAPSLDNYQMIKEIEQAREKVISGLSLSDAMHNLRSFPPYFKRMVSVGEKSENLQEVLEELANGYSQQVEIDLKMATSLIEPAIILVLGLILGAVIIAMLLPIFQMNLLAR